jgi:hypothetical protein
MRSVLFDDQGDARDPQCRTFVGELQASIAGEQLIDYAVRNLGFAAAREAGGSLRISLRPAVVSPVALAALLYWLHDREADRVLISVFDRGWSHEMLRSRQEAVRRLLARVDPGIGSREGDFLQQSLPLAALPSSSPLDGVLAMWRDSAGRFDRERLDPLLGRALNGRFVLVEASSDRPYMVIKDVGGGLTKPAKYWLTRSIGLRVEDQPDYDYGKWVAAYYRQVIAAGEPSLSDVDAVITWPQQARRSFRYRRLVVPFRGEGNSTMLLCASLTGVGIDLRVKPGEEVGNTRQQLVGSHVD